jgi:predicted DsbA family dithiol-disulfide isomerase
MKKLTLDFIADVMCPWCTLSLYALEQAIDGLGDELSVEIRLQPYELNPDAPAAGLPVFENQLQKYGLSRQQVLANFAKITTHGKKLGFSFNMEKRSHYYNTFDAQRLLHWAAESGKQLALMHALISAYFTDAKNVSDQDVLCDLAQSVGLDENETRAVLGSGRFAAEVRQLQTKYRQLGIQSVPSMIVNGRYVISGSQPAARYEQILRDIAEKAE